MNNYVREVQILGSYPVVSKMMSTSKKSLFEIYRLNKQKYLAYIYTHGWKQKLIKDVHIAKQFTHCMDWFFLIVFSA